MARPKGSKNVVKEDIDNMIANIRELDADETQKDEAIEDLEDLLEAPKRKKTLLGYHPITGEEVWL
jgi:predicted DNA binding CopG/RHH family protein